MQSLDDQLGGRDGSLAVAARGGTLKEVVLPFVAVVCSRSVRALSRRVDREPEGSARGG